MILHQFRRMPPELYWHVTIEVLTGVVTATVMDFGIEATANEGGCGDTGHPVPSYSGHMFGSE